MKIFRTLAVALLLTVSALPLAFAGTFTSTAGRFSADFVVPPKTESHDVKTAKGVTVTNNDFFAVTDDLSLGQLVEYTDLPEPLTKADLIGTARAAFDGEGRTLDGVDEGEHAGRTWILAAGHDDLLIYFYASTAVDKRLYEVTIAVPIKDATKADEVAAEQFLESVIITQ